MKDRVGQLVFINGAKNVSGRCDIYKYEIVEIAEHWYKHLPDAAASFSKRLVPTTFVGHLLVDSTPVVILDKATNYAAENKLFYQYNYCQDALFIAFAPEIGMIGITRSQFKIKDTKARKK